MTENLEHSQWEGKTDGSPFLQRWLVHVLGWMDRRLVYIFMAVVVVPGYMLLSHRGYLAQYQFFRQRMGEPWWRAFCHVYVNHFKFGQVIIDRFAVYSGKKFDFVMDGYDHWKELEQQEEGFVQCSSHVGNYEIAGYMLKAERKKFQALVFMGESPTVMKNRGQVLTPNNIHMIPVMPDMSHVFLLNSALANGDIASIPADRIFGSQKSVICRFMGADAKFPVGAFSMALARNCPVLGVWVMKRNWHTYHIVIRDIGEAVRSTEAWASAKKSDRLQMLVDEYARQLELVVRQYPTQWFNYYEFWQ